MKNQFLKRLALIAVIISTVSGCSVEKPETSIPGSELYSPEKIASMYLSSFQMNQLENIALYFSKVVDGAIIDKHARTFYDEVQVGQFKTKQTYGDDTNATVQVVYNYVGKGANASADRKKKYTTINMKMIREDGSWKIRTTGIPGIDNEVEKEIYMECMNTVMDVTIAQEILRRGKDSYSTSLSELMKIIKFNESACGEISIDQADENTFLIMATTKNLKPCNITADTDFHKPMTYDECYE